MKFICIYFVLFMLYSFMGWLMEVVMCAIHDKKWINRGFLIGPYCPIYGYGVLLIVLLLERYAYDPIALFVMAAVVCSILEYITSLVMEKVFKARWWDYSERLFNVNGRICLTNSVLFGILGCLIMYFVNPFFYSFMIKIPENILYALGIALAVVYLVDNIISFKIISGVKVAASGIIRDNTLEITQLVKKKLRERSVWSRRLINAYPNLVTMVKVQQGKIIEKTEQMKEKVEEKTQQVKELVEEKTEQIKEKLEEKTEQMKEKAEQIMDKWDRS